MRTTHYLDLNEEVEHWVPPSHRQASQASKDVGLVIGVNYTRDDAFL
jgi:hypothetical protein